MIAPLLVLAGVAVVSTLLIEGYTRRELLEFDQAQLDHFIFVDEPIVLRVGTAEILGAFSLGDNALFVELGHIDGGGEGALPLLARLCRDIAQRKGLSFLEWRVHAVHCANPNLKLRRVLTRLNFAIGHVPGVGEVYHKREAL